MDNANNEDKNSRRNTIRELRRMIYPSRGASRSTRREVSSRSTRDGPFMTFVSGNINLQIVQKCTTNGNREIY